MGKIRIAKLGGQEEEKLRDRKRVRREEKKKREEAQKVRISGMKGGERIKSVGVVSEEEQEKLIKLAKEAEKAPFETTAETPEKAKKEDVTPEAVEDKKKKAKKKARPKRVRSKKYQQNVMKIEPNKNYKIDEAIPLLRKVTLAKFDETVEMHVNTIEKGLRGSVMLPHGSGKKTRVRTVDNANIEQFVKDIESGKIDFDILIAHPQVMPKLAKIARILGPKGLMPNPKAGTISKEPEKTAKKYEKGEVNWKTEAKFPIIHLVLGKLSFKDNQLIENFKAIIKSIEERRIKNITLKSTMSPGIRIEISDK